MHDTPLMLAAPFPEVVEALLKAGAQTDVPNEFGKTALMYAVQERNAQSVALLLKAGADVNAATFDDTQCTALKAGKRTALMYAAWQGTPEIVKLLVDAHADVAARDSAGDTALAYVTKNKSLNDEERKEMQQMLAQTP